MQIFLKMATRWQPSPRTRHLFFRQNYRKEFSLDYLDGFGNFRFGFGAAGKKSRWIV